MKRNTLLLLLLVFICPLVFGEQDYHDSLNLETTNQLNNINLKIDKLITENDSLKNIINSIKTEDYKSLDVIKTVNEFYDSAWNKLMIFLSIIGAVIAFALPYYLNSQQKEKFNANKTSLQGYVNDKVVESETAIKDSNKEEIRDSLVEFEKDIKASNKAEISNSLIEFEKEINKSFANIKEEQAKDISKLYGMTFFLQATRYIKEEKHELALKSYLSSIKHQLSGDDTINRLKKTLHNINTTLTNITDKLSLKEINYIRSILKEILENLEVDLTEEITAIYESIKQNQNEE